MTITAPPPALDLNLLGAMPDTVTINQYLEDDANGNPSYHDVAVTARANIVVTQSFVEVRQAKGMRIQGSGMDIYVPAPVTMASIIVAAEGVQVKDQVTFTVDGVTYVKYVDYVTINRDNFGNPWTETLMVQITKE